MKIDTGLTAEQLKEKWKPCFDLVVSDVFTWTEDHAMAYLAEQACRCELIVESGTYMGASALMMLTAAAEERDMGRLILFAVDPFMVAGTQKVTEYFLRNYISQGRAEVLQMKSHDAVRSLTSRGLRGKIDMAWIDDGHAYEDVCYDIDCWLPMLRPGGLLCGHDFEGEVARAVKDKLPSWEEPVGRLWAYIKP